MITIALFSSNFFLSKLIQFVLNSPASHCAIGFEKDSKQYFLHAAWGGVQITARDTVLSNHSLVAEFEVKPDVSNALAFAQQKVGEPYDTVGLFGFIFVLLAEKFRIGIHNLLASKSAEVCSEFIINLNNYKQIQEFNELDSENITPKDIYSICSNGNDFKRIK